MQLLNLKAFSKLFPTLPMCKHGVRIYAYHRNSIEPFCFKHVKCLDFINIKTLLHCFIVNTGFVGENIVTNTIYCAIKEKLMQEL